jgi:uncharacterized protein (DUF2147 family)
MTLRTILTGAAMFGLMMPAAAAAPAPSVEGRWVTQARDAIVEIAPCGASLCGRIVKFLKTPPGGVDQRDVRNPDEKLRGRKLLGLSILSGFSRAGDEWRGRIYDPKSGKDYRSVLATRGGRLIVKGCLGPFCKSQSWTRTG